MLPKLFSDAYSPDNDPNAPIANIRYECQLDVLFQAARNNFYAKGKVFCLSGKSGSGKSVLIRRMCKSHNIKIVNFAPEINSEYVDSENSITEQTEKFIKKCSLLDAKSYLAVLDGIDVPDSKLNEFYNILRKTVIPTCWILSPRLSEVREIPFPTQKLSLPQTRSICEIISYICDNLEIEIDEKDIKEIAEKANGDIRTAMNSLQFGMVTERKSFTYTRGKTAKIFRGTKDIDYESLQLAYDCLPNAFGCPCDYEETLQYFSECDVGLETNDLLQETLAMAIETNNTKPRFTAIIPLKEQMKMSKVIEPETCSFEDKLMFLRKKEAIEHGEELEYETENDQKTKELIEAIELMQIDPIEDVACEEDTEISM